MHIAPLVLMATLSLAALACESVPGATEADAPDAVRLDAPGAVALPDAMAGLPLDTVDVQGVTVARARLLSVEGGGATGLVTLTRVDGGVRVLAEVEGLTLDAYHALQILHTRDCDVDDAVHLGDDGDTPHGSPYSLPGLRHAGDLGNIRGQAEGMGRYDRVDGVLSLDGTTSPVNRAVVIRAGRDDAASADGAAGDVVGCGVIERVR